MGISRFTIPPSTVIFYGGKPTVSPVTITPQFYYPDFGSASVSATIGGINSLTAVVTIQNQANLSVLRTINLAAQSPGALSIPWDGRADNGMLVSPGAYTVNLTVSDNVGNVVSSYGIVTIQY
jgi:flagellar hook assembly protein FlgD